MYYNIYNIVIYNIIIYYNIPNKNFTEISKVLYGCHTICLISLKQVNE